jgi:23S rRNA (pseudouridine1915-N3)-methyltransferase
MRLRIVALGQRMPAWVDAGYAEYAKRMPREYALELCELKAAPRDRGRSVTQLLATEAAQLRSVCGNDYIVALDERGSAWRTRDLAANLSRWRANDASVVFVIGSADGLDEAFKRSANERLAISPMTLPHGLARIVLAEQLYRAASLVAGHPYHRE